LTSTNSCLDAETLAAWVDGGLDPAAAAMAEAHVSSCERCQEIIGLMAHTTAVHDTRVAAPELPWWRRFGAGWLIPLTAGVAAVGLWMIVPANRSASTPPQSPAARQAKADQARDKDAPAAVAEAPAERFRESQEKRQQDATAVDQLAKRFEQPAPSKNKEEKLADRVDERALGARPTPPAATEAMAPAAPALGRTNAQAESNVASREIASPNPRTRWRLVGDGNVEYTSDGGASWEVIATGVTDQLTAGSSPTADVCWIVGRNGIVLLTTDGRRWQRLPFPETMDLAAVQATDSRSALVTAADGMLFQTRDSGATWSRP